MSTIKKAVTALFLSAALSAPALAADGAAKARMDAPEVQGGVRVTYADLNLASSAGQEILDRRIKHAAEKVCGRLNGTLRTDMEVRKCRRKAIAAVQSSRDLAIATYNAQRLASADPSDIRLIAQ
ncbi:MAG: UrcA family protein [Pseudomonadota bacterium]